MNPVSWLRKWWQARTGQEETPFDGDAPAWLISLTVHLGLLILLTATLASAVRETSSGVEFSTVPVHEDFEAPQEFSYSELNTKEVGSNSAGGLTTADSLGAVETDISQLGASAGTAAPTVELPTVENGNGTIAVQSLIGSSSGTELSETLLRQGAAGVGTTGAAGAVDRITRELLDSMEQRKTLVVWMFDQSLSLSAQRAAIYKRLDRIYEELGVVEASQHPAFAKHHDKPLLTSVIAYAKDYHFLTPRPTDQLSEIKAAIASIKDDNSGDEYTFTTITRAAEEYKSYTMGDSPRNVIFITFTDESGDDADKMLDVAVATCRKYSVRNFIVGVPAPFGRKEVEVKWVDPDPRYNQEPQWPTLNQGPESFWPERLKIGYTGRRHHEEPLDSGFGPFSLTRLAVSTGGLYFTVHPARRTDGRPVRRDEIPNLSSFLERFFDADVMRKYRPDYVTGDEYKRRLKSNRAKMALSTAAGLTWVNPISDPKLHFPRRDEADLSRQLSAAQQQAAKLEPKVQAVYSALVTGKMDRDKLTEPRWQAGYDLAMGQALALKVRTEGYNLMLAKAKRGMKFQSPKSDTWDLRPSREVHAGSAVEKEAQQAETYLNRVVEDHPNTPWALLASQELADPLGWEWRESFTNVNPPQVAQANNNNKPPPKPRDDQRNMIPQKVTRPPPKL
ncbi:MAG: VWA domain-containing protein [Planctomycetia bacterium]|nr:VWA domain-containing protein [Planctomycetia bacterium]